MKRFHPIIVIVFVLIIHVVLVNNLWEIRDGIRSNRPGYVIPSEFSRILSLGNAGILSDFLFLKVLTFYGEHVMRHDVITDEGWKYLVDGLDVVTELDPFFLDPYVFAQGVLAWEKGKTKEAIRLLNRGVEHRKEDWRLPFYVGFNYFYILGDYEKGADYLMIASRRPNSPSFLSTLAARVGYYSGKPQTAIVFLRAMISDTENPNIRARLELRVLALENAARLDSLVAKYAEKEGSLPESVNDLIAAGYIDKIPEDPYGGQWIILENGRVYSTSKFTFSVNK